MKKFIPIIMGLGLLFAPPLRGADKSAEKKPAAEETKKTTEESEESYYEQLKKMLKDLTDSSKEATEKGKEMSEEAKEWVKEDFSKIGDWEYTQLVIQLDELPNLAKKLNVLGKDRWDCFWVHQQGKEIHLLCKRPAISYLHKLGRADLLKLLPFGGDKE